MVPETLTLYNGKLLKSPPVKKNNNGKTSTTQNSEYGTQDKQIYFHGALTPTSATSSGNMLSLGVDLIETHVEGAGQRVG